MKYRYWANENDFYLWENETRINWTDPEVFIAINNSLKIIRLDPEFAVLQRSQHINFIGNFGLYQLINASAIRTGPDRILYDPKKHLLFFLDGTNVPIYKAWELSFRDGMRAFITRANVLSYIKFFFNSVKGAHGRYELVDSIDDVKNRVNNYYHINSKFSKTSKFSAAVWHDALTTYFANGELTIRRDAKEITVRGVSMVFYSSLFKADITVNVNPKDKNYGQVQLKNEVVGEIQAEAAEINFLTFDKVDKEVRTIIPFFK